MLRVEPADVSADYAVLTLMGPEAGREQAGGAAAALELPFGTDLIVPRAALADAAAGLQAAGAVLRRHVGP